MFSISIERAICHNMCKRKSLEEIIFSDTVHCSMQYQGRYILDQEVSQSFDITSLSGVDFIPQFLMDLNKFPIRILVQFESSLYPIFEFIQSLERNHLPYYIFDFNGIPISPLIKKSYYHILFEVTNEKQLSMLFENYLYDIVANNNFVGFWIGEIPCFSLYQGFQSSKDHRLWDTPMLLLDMKQFLVTINYDISGITLINKHGILTFVQLRYQLKSFSIESYTETGFACC